MSTEALLIRPGTASDAEAILAINAQCRPQVARLSRAELGRLLSNGGQILLAQDRGGTAQGYLIAFDRESRYDGEEYLRFRLAIDRRFFYVDQIAVARNARHRGIGRLLYEHVSSLAKRVGNELLCCEVNVVPPNEASMAFHERLGFSPFESMNTSDGRTVVLLTMTLSPGT